MRYSQLFVSTLRETPVEAVIASHRLMLRAGMIRQLSAGIYTYLPLGYKALRKVETIIREEMDAAGAQEILMPALQPQELWEKSGRLDVYVSENIMFRTKDRQNRMYCLGPTHEEVVCETAASRIRSYRDMPFTLYQIQTKFRDEIRPRFGLMRGKEFIMKDAYSFDIDVEGMNESYVAMYDAYSKIFTRCGLKFRPVEADSGAIGGDASHEFMVLSDTGEDGIVSCPQCNYSANLERAEIGGYLEDMNPDVELAPLVDIDTPDVRTIEELTEFLGVSPQSFIKTMIYVADGKPVVALVRGDHEVNEIKLRRALKADTLAKADDETVERITGAPVGFAGPHALKEKVPIIMDRGLSSMTNAISGACKKDTHTKNVNRGRDYNIDKMEDIRIAGDSDGCPRCSGTLEMFRGVEVGHVFKLGTKYSKPLNVVYTDTDGVEAPAVMGCYGIGVGRTLAAVVEQHHDDNGIIWPVAIAPYIVDVMAISSKDEAQTVAAEKIYKDLKSAGIDTLIDDRDERPGVKFKDADLIGIPIRIVAGKSIKDGLLEVQIRRSGEKLMIPAADILSEVKRIIKELS